MSEQDPFESRRFVCIPVYAYMDSCVLLWKFHTRLYTVIETYHTEQLRWTDNTVLIREIWNGQLFYVFMGFGLKY